MKYFLRSVKWFVYCVILFVLIILVLHLMGSVDARNVESLFRDGYNSLWQIALFLAVLSAVYPKFGYMKREIRLKENVGEIRTAVRTILKEYEYVLQNEADNIMVFKTRSMFVRVLQMGEDTISIGLGEGVIEIEGKRRNVARVISRLEHRLGAA